MIVFAKKVFIFLIPFFLLITIEALIDPFNYFSAEKNKEMQNIKEDISQKVNPYLYKFIQYDENPCSTIILGDSRIALLSPSFFEDNVTGTISNLAFGGGSLQDAIETFWYVCKKHDIKKVYIGISIETYSGTLLRNRATPSIKIKNFFLSYLLNRYTFESTMLICKKKLFNAQIDINKPPFSKDEFWQNQLNWEARYLKNYSYPKNYYNDFKKIERYCSEKNIKLVFVLSPTHTDLQNKIHEFHLEKENEKFMQDICSFGDVYDFNYPNNITNNKNNFTDPFHHSDSISKIVVKEITTNNIKYAKFTSQNKKIDKKSD
jgi:hypothetical protein